MTISSNTLFHFTRKLENLIGILKEDFKPKYCVEDLSVLEFPKSFVQAVPMTCFCDLPLSQLGEHLSFYGNYGIGLSKEWGFKNGIGPLIYLRPNSLLADYFSKITSILVKQKKTEESNFALIYVFELLGFVKPYSGHFPKDGQMVHKRFYDEREWRWVPQIGLDNDIKPRYFENKEYENEELLAYANLKLSEKTRLLFTPEDIKYIIVSKESEILDMVNELKDLKLKFGEKAVKLLQSKVISSEQIREDF